MLNLIYLRSQLLFLSVVTILVWSNHIEARVFEMGRESLGSYLLFGASTPVIRNDPFYNESSAGQFSAEYNTAYLTDFGMIYQTKWVGLRFGFEIARPNSIDNGQAKTNSGANLYKYNNTINMFGYMAGLDINLVTTTETRTYIFGFGGAISLTMATDYHSVNISPNVRHQANVKGNGTLAGGGMGFEILMFDASTFTMEGGYRQLKFNSLTYTSATTTFTGAKAIGDTVQDVDGNTRTINMSGPYLSIGFRTYMF